MALGDASRSVDQTPGTSGAFCTGPSRGVTQNSMFASRSSGVGSWGGTGASLSALGFTRATLLLCGGGGGTGVGRDWPALCVSLLPKKERACPAAGGGSGTRAGSDGCTLLLLLLERACVC